MEMILYNTAQLLQRESTTINDKIIAKYLKQLDTSDTTKTTYLNGVRKFMNWLNDNNIEQVNEDDIYNYKAYLRANYSASSVNSYVMAVKSLFKFIERKGGINLAKNLKGSKTPKNHKRDSLTIEQVKAILKAIDTTTLEGKRNNALFRLLISSGMRECEIVNANVNDIRNIGNEVVIYVKGKGHEAKDDFIKLTREAKTLEAINDYLIARKPRSANEPLFTSLSDRNKGERLTTRSIRNIVKKLYKNGGVYSEFITTHSTRHTAITLNLIGGASLQEVQQLARHSNINTTLIYSHNLNKLNSNTDGLINSMLDD